MGLELLRRIAVGAYLPGRLHTLCLNYIEEAAKYKATYVYMLKPQLEAVRSCSDAAERLCADARWPFPKYKDVLFSHHFEAPQLE